MSNPVVKKYLIRFLIVTLISFSAALIMNEVFFNLQKDRSINRKPGVITLVIPAGTDAEIKSGKTDVGIPQSMTFVVGDVLEVWNEDSVTLQLGPLYIPPRSTARMPLDVIDQYTLGCSFQSGKFLGLDVRQPTTLSTRMYALFAAGPTTTIFLFFTTFEQTKTTLP